MSDEMENENYKMICNLSNRARFRFTSPYEVSMKRRCLKRRGLSPKIFPRKVLVTEDIVTSHLN
uniref:Uncharacterized protein n=1 Tax=Ciona intestinalis TaxID=7719 RepID=F7BKD6_CIOIN